MSFYKPEKQRNLTTVRDGLGHEIVKIFKVDLNCFLAEFPTKTPSDPFIVNEGGLFQAQMSTVKP